MNDHMRKLTNVLCIPFKNERLAQINSTRRVVKNVLFFLQDQRVGPPSPDGNPNIYFTKRYKLFVPTPISMMEIPNKIY